MKRFLFLTIITATAVGALAQPVPAAMSPQVGGPETVSVSGTGRVTVIPDRFSFTVGVQTMGSTVDEAVSQNNQRSAAVIAALKRAGAKEADIQTSNFSIWPQQEFNEKSLPRIVGYQVSNNVTVRSTKIADAGRFLGVAIGAGVNTSSGINFEVSDPAKGRDEGLRSAFDDARAKAALLAQAAGRTLGRALIISEGSQAAPPPYPMPRVMAMEAKAQSQDVPVEAGSQDLNFTVSVVFALQ